MGEESGKSRSPQSAGRSYSADAVPETKAAEEGDRYQCRVELRGMALLLSTEEELPRRLAAPVCRWIPEKLQVRERRWSKTQAGNRNVNGKTARTERNQPGASTEIVDRKRE